MIVYKFFWVINLSQNMNRYLKYIFSYSIISLGVLISTELILSKDKVKQKYYKYERSIILREHSPNTFLKIRKKHSSRTYNFSTDSNGYVKPSIIHDKDNINILFLGGSTTEIKYVNELKRFPYLVGRILDSQTKNLNFNTINAGRAGNNSMHSLNLFLNKGIWAPSKPEIVVLMHAINDLNTLAYYNTYYLINHPRGILVKKDISSFDTRIISYQIRRFFPNLTEKFLQMMNKIKYANIPEDEFVRYRGRKNRVDTIKIKKLFKSSLSNFVDTSKSWGVKPVLMTQPNLYAISNENINLENFAFTKQTDLNYSQFVNLYMEFNQIIREIAINKSINLIDLAQLIPKDKKYFQNGSPIHFNEEGSKLAAQIIADKLAKEILR